MSKFRLDEVDHQILDMLIDNTRVPFTDIAKKLLISAGTVHVRVKKTRRCWYNNGFFIDT
jgi:Lrp/AsnC family transcriptional regulator for asnA, asnC and gidA